jgi:NAD(P)-dependent dehydrogenase (short-subunit alcohol dehydrogenase family)
MAAPKPGKYASKLFDNNVLVLGGTSGIGFAVAEAAWEFGAKVTISGTNQPKIDTKMSEMKSNNPAGDISKLRGFPCDLGSQNKMEENLKALLDFTTNNGQNKLDHIVFCSGDIPPFKPLVEIDVAPYTQAGSLLRFVAPITIAKLCAIHGYLNLSPTSSLTLTSGIKTTKPGKGWSVFAGIGGTVEGMARGLAVDLAPIRVNCVAPGAVHTERFEKFAKDRLEGTLKSYKEKSLTGTVGRPEDTAEAYLYCMRDRFVTGALIESNGGGLLA